MSLAISVQLQSGTSEEYGRRSYLYTDFMSHKNNSSEADDPKVDIHVEFTNFGVDFDIMKKVLVSFLCSNFGLTKAVSVSQYRH